MNDKKYISKPSAKIPTLQLSDYGAYKLITSLKAEVDIEQMERVTLR